MKKWEVRTNQNLNNSNTKLFTILAFIKHKKKTK